VFEFQLKQTWLLNKAEFRIDRIVAGEEPHPQNPDPEEAYEAGDPSAPGGAEEEEGPRYHQKPC